MNCDSPHRRRPHDQPHAHVARIGAAHKLARFDARGERGAVAGSARTRAAARRRALRALARRATGKPQRRQRRHTRKRREAAARHVRIRHIQPAFRGERLHGEMRKRRGANSTARPNAVANPLPASTACRSKRHHARDNESGQAQAAALINAAQTPRFNKTPRQSRFYTRLTSLVKHGEFVSDLCYHQATSQEKFHMGNHMRNSHPIQRCWDKGAIPFSHSRGGLDVACPLSLRQQEGQVERER